MRLECAKCDALIKKIDELQNYINAILAELEMYKVKNPICEEEIECKQVSCLDLV